MLKKSSSFYKQPILYILLIAVIIAVSVIFIVIFSSASCSKGKSSYDIAITANGFEPKNNTVQVCTKVVFINRDSSEHLIAFGEHSHHADPPGFLEKELTPGQTNQFVPTKSGALVFHEHDNDDFKGTLTVTK